MNEEEYFLKCVGTFKWLLSHLWALSSRAVKMVKKLITHIEYFFHSRGKKVNQKNQNQNQNNQIN